MGEVGCLVNIAALFLGCLGVSVPKVDLSWYVKWERATPGFGLKFMLGVYLCVSGPCIFHIYCVTRSNL